MEDKEGMIAFIFLHVPLFYWFVYEIDMGHQNFTKGFSIFMVVHLLLHILLLRHKNNEFKDWISWTIIIGAGVSGLINLAILLAL